MEDNFDFTDYENSYINIPIFILKSYWKGQLAGFDYFILNIIAFGTASEQIIRLVEDGYTFEPTCTAAENNLEIFMTFLEEWSCACQQHVVMSSEDNFYSIVQNYKEWINQNGDKDWMKRGGWVGITVYNLRQMILERNSISPAKKERWEESWLIHFGIKSVIGFRKYAECSWQWILTRALGFFDNKEYTEEMGNAANWTSQFREKRKTKIKAIEKQISDFGLIYSPYDEDNNKQRSCPRYALSKKRVHYRKQKGTP